MGSSIRMGLLGVALSLAPVSAFAATHGVKADPGFHTAAAHQTQAQSREDARQGPAKYRLALSPKARGALADQKRDEVIADLRRIAAKFDDDSPKKPDLLLQLSEFYWEKEQYLYDREMERQDQAWAAHDAAIAKGQQAVEPKADHRGSDHYRQLAMGIYDRLLNQYPHYARRDEVLFLLGYNLNDLNRGKEAVARYAQLIKEFPHSRFVPDAYVQLGNFWFNHDKLEAARANYEKALETDVPKIHSYALYKLAWCDYNVGAFDKALAKLQTVVDYSSTRKEMVDLRNEALKDLVVVYTRLDQADAGRLYFEKHAPPEKQGHLIARLADGVAESGHYDDAIKTYRTLIARAPMGPSAPDYQQAVVHCFEGLRQRAQVKKEIQTLARNYRPGSAWWKANAKDTDVLRSAFDVSEEAMRQVVTEYHQEAQKTQQVETYKLARDIYKEYLDAFASSADPQWVSDQAFNLRFYYAEILWTLEDWADAAAQYDQVVAFHIPDRQSAKSLSHLEYRKTAAFDAILAYDKLVKIERGELSASTLHDGDKVDGSKEKGDVEKGVSLDKQDDGDGTEKPLTPAEQRLVAACDAYTRLFPGAKDEIEIRYQAAVVFYRRNHFDQAAKRFQAIVLKWPGEKRSQEAADLTLHVLESKHDWAKLSQVAKAFASNPQLTKPGTAFATRLEDVVQGSQYKWVSETLYSKEHDKARAAEEFLRYASEFPHSPNADRALTYAMLTFQEEHQFDRAIDAGERALRETPASPLTLKVRFTLAHLYEHVADFQRAAEMNESLVATFDRQKAQLAKETKQAGARSKAAATDAAPRTLKGGFTLEEKQQLLAEAESWVPDAQFDAAVWWEGLDKTDRAVASYRAYLRRFPERKDAPEIAFHVGELFAQEKRWRDAARAFEDFSERFAHDKRTTGARRYLALSRELEAYEALHQTSRADATREALLRGHARLSQQDQQDAQVVTAYGQARFLSVEPSWKEYGQVRLNHLSSLRAELGQKQRLLKALERGYTDVVATGSGEYAIAALTRLGTGYADFAEAIRHSPTPRGLSGDQVQLYRQELEKLAMPLETKAVEALHQGLGKAYELGIYGSWTLAAQEVLNRYQPGLYAPVREVPFREADASPAVLAPKVPAASPASVAVRIDAPASVK